MLKVEQINWEPAHWRSEWERFEDRTVFQSPEWMKFLAETQGGRPVLLGLSDAGTLVGYFSGLLVRYCGLKILGSPLPGWTTAYMGFNLQPHIHRAEAAIAVERFAFRELGCVHFEMMDRHLDPSPLDQVGWQKRMFCGYEIDLSSEEAMLFGNMDGACRRCIRKAQRCGVTVETAHDDHFCNDYYNQLMEVFARQRLAPTYRRLRVRALVRNLLPAGLVLLLRARDAEGRCIATGIFPIMHDRMYFWGGASRRQYQILRPNELLMWTAMLYAKSWKIRWFDMGGAGDYKRKYGGREIAVPWLRRSRYPVLESARAVAQQLVRLRSRAAGAFTNAGGRFADCKAG